uniref:Putative laccase 9 n=1 Tax=Flammulina velutipes TaxID=38945 RepID=V9XNA6_FLAVE|nr:putative laccase 9 [Flammulina velutipes]
MFSLGISSILLLLSRVSWVAADDVNFILDIANDVVAPDGFDRAGVIVNGIFPGTIIQANKDDVLHITANNLLTDPTMRRSLTIHWHGLFQMRTATEDGPAFVNQCPVAPDHSYTYDIPLNGQAGTYWYHSHLASQYVDGLRGALIVYDPVDPHLGLYDIDDASTVITLADWYHLPSIGLTEQFLEVKSFHEPIADSGLINGKGRFVGGPQVDWSRINVVAGKRYRFRIINMSGYGEFDFAIDGHDMTIIEVDGVSHAPLRVDSFKIYAAQRYSFVVHANQPVDNYWISAPMEMHHSGDNDNLDGDNVFAVLHYEGAPDADPTEDPLVAFKKGDELEEHLLVPLFNPEAPGGAGPADHVIDLEFKEEVNRTTGHRIWTINGLGYIPPDLPTLLNVIANNATGMGSFGPNENTHVLNFNETVELVIHGSAGGHTHPFHLHGHAFSIVEGMTGPPNFVNPPQRDVVGIGGSTVRIRFRADNPGPWFLHCHIDWHLEAGLAVVFAEAPREQREGPQSLIIKPEYLELCPIYNALAPELQ